ncbi:2-hydroxy-acid oxidase [Rhodosalinus halophilus]|uniref:2-hydroxy-acid oxidase n=1 Tax=Rhodosalinus halophilus TaxID=2259333 RepID=A0A365UB31_9RHOB|nr:FAD-binding protein [Rhodosalinus halophilus]RBI85951.1 2-hydroxy-acid oxidase [Rhodosalinus halophilus]
MAPGTEAELAEAVAGATGPLAIRGGGTRGAAPEGEVLSVAGLSGVRLYEPGALTLVAGAGTPLAEIDALLAREGQRLAFEPMDHRGLMGTEGEPTIGGVFAANVSGPRRIAVGAARDFALGLRFVDGAGHVVANGGRVMKNVTGYDLVKLLCGSRGRLGVLSEISLKVLPAPETSGMLVLEGLETGRAVAAMAAALGSPYEVTGAAHDPAAARTLLRLEGFESQVGYRLERLAAQLADFGTPEAVRDPEEVARTWAAVRDVEALQEAGGAIWRVHCRPSVAPDLVARARAEGALLDWGGGLIWLRVPEGTDLRARLGRFDGHATRVRGDGPEPAAPPEAPAVAALAEGLRRRFDPRGIFDAEG